MASSELYVAHGGISACSRMISLRKWPANASAYWSAPPQRGENSIGTRILDRLTTSHLLYLVLAPPPLYVCKSDEEIRFYGRLFDQVAPPDRRTPIFVGVVSALWIGARRHPERRPPIGWIALPAPFQQDQTLAHIAILAGRDHVFRLVRQ